MIIIEKEGRINSMKKILITGGSGFLGSRICWYLKQKSEQVDVLSQKKTNKCYEVYAPSHKEMDIIDFESVKAYIQEIKPEVVIHCAAISDTGYTEEHKEESFEINVIGTENLAKVTGQMGIRFIFMSSDQIFNGKTIVGENYEKTVDACVEERDDKPINEYGRQKKEAEKRSLMANPNTVALRLTWMYDISREGMKTNRNLLTNLLEAHKNGDKLKFARHEYRGITNVWEVVTNLEKVFDIPSGVYNYGSENDKPTIEVARKAVWPLNLPEEIVEEDIERFAERPRNLTISNKKLRDVGIEFRNTVDGLIF